MTMITAREAVAFGQSSRAQREAWQLRHWADQVDPFAKRAREEAARLGQVADAYAHGWLAGRVGADLTPESREELRELAYVFGVEYEHAAWLYATERAGSRPGYARAWEDALATRGY